MACSLGREEIKFMSSLRNQCDVCGSRRCVMYLQGSGGNNHIKTENGCQARQTEKQEGLVRPHLGVELTAH